ncbi:expressed unknown protein [Seminavis robusta]|uniref:Uncharacterized protein n=1 Tax=Seminavis robusta TaxID=568900 RepID=A0A9N8EZJ1_9STRA|nr:expressed unknown protein [Seminavis robusta]|eukprot:Sro2325_g323380.1 n/a (546) ;mRNA; f:4102-5739
MMQPTDMNMDRSNTGPQASNEGGGGSKALKEPAWTQKKTWMLAAGTLLSFAAMVIGVAMLVHLTESPTHANQNTLSDLVHDAQGSDAAGANVKLSKDAAPGHPVKKKVPKQLDTTTTNTTTFMVEYVLSWHSDGRNCTTPSSLLGARCGEGAILSLPEHDRNDHTCNISLEGNASASFSCNDTSRGAVVIVCESPNKEVLALNAQWYGDRLECDINGSATQSLALGAIDSDGNDVPVGEKICLAIWDPALPRSRCRSPLRQSRCTSPYECEASILCRGSDLCTISGVMITTPDTSSLEDNGCIRPVLPPSPCVPSPCLSEQICTEVDGGYRCIDNNSTVSTEYVVLWKSDGGGGDPMYRPEYLGCEIPQPELTASCGGNGVLRILEAELSNHECINIDDGSIVCAAHGREPGDPEVVGVVLIRCETTSDGDDTDLVLTVTMPEETLFCNGALEPYEWYGGWAYNFLQVVTVCNGEFVTMDGDTCSGTMERDDADSLQRCVMRDDCRENVFWGWDCEAELNETLYTTSGPLVANSGCVVSGSSVSK